jgi:trans-2,3-dihydro-3-hydroxyanthranilate isomerase
MMNNFINELRMRPPQVIGAHYMGNDAFNTDVGQVLCSKTKHCPTMLESYNVLGIGLIETRESSMKRRFYITDVFHEGAYSGNQLATIIDTENLSDEEMLNIAREFNFAETTFFLGGSPENGFDVRIFTPNKEVPFAGHPSLGTAFLIKNYLCEIPNNQLTLNLEVGKIDITFNEGEVIWMKQPEPTFGQTYSIEEIVDALKLKIEDLDHRFPIQLVSTGLEFLMVPLVSLDALKRCSVLQSPALGTFVFCRETYDQGHNIAARMFAPEVGVTEDAATGSANGCLASYILEHNYLDSTEINIRVAQGREIKRPSILHLQARKTEGRFDINVGGKVRLVAEGNLLSD